jgi:hypothetical protein
MVSDNSSRGEKLSIIKLTVVQYGILFVMLATDGPTMAAAGAGRAEPIGIEKWKAKDAYQFSTPSTTTAR